MKTGEVSIYQQYEDKIQSLERQLNAKTIGFDLAKRMIRGKNKELDYKDEKISELESEVARLQAMVPQWIPIKEASLQDESEWLVIDCAEDINKCYRTSNGFHLDGGQTVHDVTHVMKLPEVPKL